MRRPSTRGEATCIFAPPRFCGGRAAGRPRSDAGSRRWMCSPRRPDGRRSTRRRSWPSLDAIASRKLLPELRDPADKMVRAYIARNGNYRADALLRAAFRAPNDAAAGADWLIDLSRAAPNQVVMLAAIAKAAWLPDLQRDRVYERIVAVSEETVAREHGAAQAAAQAQLDGWRLLRIRSLVETKQTMRADELLRALPEATRLAHDADVTALETRIAAAARALDALLDRYGARGAPAGEPRRLAKRRHGASSGGRSGVGPPHHGVRLHAPARSRGAGAARLPRARRDSSAAGQYPRGARPPAPADARGRRAVRQSGRVRRRCSNG